MLKLEKIAKTLEISVTLRKNERFLNKAFLQALLIAIGLHLFGGVLFSVRLSKIMGSQQIFPPAIVESDIDYSFDSSVMAQLEMEEVFPRHIKEPRGSKPLLPSFPEPIYSRTSELKKPCEWNCKAFGPMHELAAALEIPLPAKKMISRRGVALKISGALEQERLLAQNGENVDLSLLETLPASSFKKTYFVQLENRTGELFWYFSPDTSSNEEVDGLSETILKSLTFVPNEKAFATDGEIEIIFNKGSSA